jgi:hypothetical protein
MRTLLSRKSPVIRPWRWQSSRSNVLRRQLAASFPDARERRFALIGSDRACDLHGSRAGAPQLDLIAPALDELPSVVAPIKYLAGFINSVCRLLITCDSGPALHNSSGLAPAPWVRSLFLPF